VENIRPFMNRNLVRFSMTGADTEAEVDRAIRNLEAVWEPLRGARESAPLESQMSQM
jgi:cysteine sulfinate desulfinase/cysteine desulfurase-like protein